MSCEKMDSCDRTIVIVILGFLAAAVLIIASCNLYYAAIHRAAFEAGYTQRTVPGHDTPVWVAPWEADR